MGDVATNGRLHDPTLRELTADLDGTRALVLARLDALREVLDERDRLYKERDDARRTAVDAALAAVKEQTRASFDASEKAIVKAEEAQKAYNVAHNDLARKMDEQNKATMPRTETETRFRNIDEKIADIREKLSGDEGVKKGHGSVKDDARANIALAVSLIGVVVLLIGFFATR